MPRRTRKMDSIGIASNAARSTDPSRLCASVTRSPRCLFVNDIGLESSELNAIIQSHLSNSSECIGEFVLSVVSGCHLVKLPSTTRTHSPGVEPIHGTTSS